MCLKVHILQKLYLYSEKWKIIYFHLRWQELGICQQTALLLLSDSLFLSFTVLPNSTPVSSLVLWFLFFLAPLSDRSSVEQGCFLFLLSPKPFSFGWSVKDSDNQRGEARRPAGEGAQEAGQIYWAASGRRTIRQGRAMPHSAARSGKDFSLRLRLMSAFVCRYAGYTVRRKYSEGLISEINLDYTFFSYLFFKLKVQFI